MLPISVNTGSLLLRWKKKEYDFKNVKGISNKGSSVCSGSTFEVSVAFICFFFYFEWMAQILVKKLQGNKNRAYIAALKKSAKLVQKLLN